MTANWALLEHELLNATEQLAEIAGIPLPEHATSLSFKKRLRALRALIKTAIKPTDDTKRLLDLLTKIGSAERSRNRITHGLWDWADENPGKLSASSYRTPFDFEEPFDHVKLTGICERVGEFTFQLRFPGGKKDAEEALAQRGGGISRHGMQVLQGRVPLDPHPDQASPPKDK